MLGFGDGWVAAVYLLCLASTLLCVVYGILHWNDGEDALPPVKPSQEELEMEDAAV